MRDVLQHNVQVCFEMLAVESFNSAIGCLYGTGLDAFYGSCLVGGERQLAHVGGEMAREVRVRREGFIEGDFGECTWLDDYATGFVAEHAFAGVGGLVW